MKIPLDGQTRIGVQDRGNRLGTSAVLGRTVWDCQHKFRLVIGPLDHAEYQRMLPGGDSMRRLLAWVRNYAGMVLDWDVRLILKQQEIPRLALGARRLGWTTFLASTPPKRDSHHLLINPTAFAG